MRNSPSENAERRRKEGSKVLGEYSTPTGKENVYEIKSRALSRRKSRKTKKGKDMEMAERIGYRGWRFEERLYSSPATGQEEKAVKRNPGEKKDDPDGPTMFRRREPRRR